jgi:hypothetical protein
MRVLLYFSTLTPSLVKAWVDIADRFNDRMGSHLSINFGSQDFEKEYLRCGGSTEHIIAGPWTLLQRLDSMNLESLTRLTAAYDPISLGRLRIMGFPGQQRVEHDFEKRLLIYEGYFSDLLSEARVDQILIMEPKSVKYDAVLATLELVANKRKIPVRLIHVVGTWCNIGVQNGLSRTSHAVEKTYSEICCGGGLSDDQKEKVDKFFSAYERLMKSDWAHGIKFRDQSSLLQTVISVLSGSAGPGVLKARFQRVRRSFDSWEPGSSPYVLFLPNKANNSRSRYLSPFFQNTASIIEQIAISLPLTHRLVIKDHPHMEMGHKDTDLYQAVDRYSNCFFINPREDLVDLIDKSAMVFVVGSSSGLEALTRKKHVIFFGSKTYVIGQCDGVVTTVSAPESLPALIEKCIEYPPPIENIYSFFFALLTHTYRMGAVPDENWEQLSTEGASNKLISIVEQYLEREL